MSPEDVVLDYQKLIFGITVSAFCKETLDRIHEYRKTHNDTETINFLILAFQELIVIHEVGEMQEILKDL